MNDDRFGRDDMLQSELATEPAPQDEAPVTNVDNAEPKRSAGKEELMLFKVLDEYEALAIACGCDRSTSSPQVAPETDKPNATVYELYQELSCPKEELISILQSIPVYYYDQDYEAISSLVAINPILQSSEYIANVKRDSNSQNASDEREGSTSYASLHPNIGPAYRQIEGAFEILGSQVQSNDCISILIATPGVDLSVHVPDMFKEYISIRLRPKESLTVTIYKAPLEDKVFDIPVEVRAMYGDAIEPLRINYHKHECGGIALAQWQKRWFFGASEELLTELLKNDPYIQPEIIHTITLLHDLRTSRLKLDTESSLHVDLNARLDGAIAPSLKALLCFREDFTLSMENHGIVKKHKEQYVGPNDDRNLVEQCIKEWKNIATKTTKSSVKLCAMTAVMILEGRTAIDIAKSTKDQCAESHSPSEDCIYAAFKEFCDAKDKNMRLTRIYPFINEIAQQFDIPAVRGRKKKHTKKSTRIPKKQRS